MPSKNITEMVKNKESLKKTLSNFRKTKKEKPVEFRKAKKELRRISRRIKVIKMAEDRKKKPVAPATVPVAETKPASAPAAQPATTPATPPVETPPAASPEPSAEPKT